MNIKEQFIHEIEKFGLDDIQKQIIYLRYGVYKSSVSMQDLFKKFDITYDDFKQIEKKVHQYLKEHFPEYRNSIPVPNSEVTNWDDGEIYLHPKHHARPASFANLKPKYPPCINPSQ